MGVKHSKAARFSSSISSKDLSIEKDKALKEESMKKKKYVENETPKNVGGEVDPLPTKKKASRGKKYRDEDVGEAVGDVPAQQDEEELFVTRKTRAPKMVKKEEEAVAEERDEQAGERQKEVLEEKYGEFGETVNQRVENILHQTTESQSDFEDMMDTFLNKLTNARILVEDMYEGSDMMDDLSRKIDGLNIAMIRSNYFIGQVIQSMLSQRETMIFQTNDPFFKMIPVYLWRKYEKHYNNLIMIQKRNPENENDFRRLQRKDVGDYRRRDVDSSIDFSRSGSADLSKSGTIDYTKSSTLDSSSNYLLHGSPDEEYTKYDMMTREFNDLVHFLEDLSDFDKESKESAQSYRHKRDNTVSLLTDIESDSRKNYNHTKNALNILKDDLRDLMGIYEQANDSYTDIPPGFYKLDGASRESDKQRMKLKTLSDDIRTSLLPLFELRKELEKEKRNERTGERRKIKEVESDDEVRHGESTEYLDDEDVVITDEVKRMRRVRRRSDTGLDYARPDDASRTMMDSLGMQVSQRSDGTSRNPLLYSTDIESMSFDDVRMITFSTARIQTIFWHLYVIKHLFIPELFTMDRDEMSFRKVKNIITRMKFTRIFKNTYTEVDAKTVLMKYIFEVLLETNDLLENHIEFSYRLENRKGEGRGQVRESDEVEKRRSRDRAKNEEILDESIRSTKKNMNEIDKVMKRVEELFREVKEDYRVN